MTEIEYVLENFDKNFIKFRKRKILLHGSRNYAKAILQHYGESYNFIGVMSMDSLEGTSWNDLPIFGEEDLQSDKVDIVILTERVKYAEAAFLSIRKRCRKSGIEIYNMYGLDEYLLHYQAMTAEPLTLTSALRLCDQYDIISFEVMDTVFPSAQGQSKMIPNMPFSDLIPALRKQGKELRFSLRKSFPEDIQIQALKGYSFFTGDQELIRRSGEDLSFRTLKNSAPEKKILYFGSGLVNEFILPRCYGIDSVRFVKRSVLDFDCLLPRRAVPEKVPFTVAKREVLQDQIREHNLISFDVFDTLLIRKTLYPRDVFALVEQKAKITGYRAEGFAVARAKAEDECPFCTLDQVYEILADLYDWDPKTKDAMEDIELRMERSVLETRSAMVEMFYFALKQGKQVVLTSDMYLPEITLRELLEENGIRGFEKIFVSCDCKKAKVNGLYMQLLSMCGETGKILHIGDNPVTDGDAPKALGIDSIVVPSALSIALKCSWTHVVEIAFSLAERCLVGLTISRLFTDPFRNPNNWERSVPARMAYMGNGVVGPLVVGHMCWLIKKLREGHYNGVLFLARDGWLSYKLYEKIRCNLILPPAFYFQANRHAAFLCCSDEDLQSDRMGELGKSFGLDANQLLEKVYLIPKKEQLPHHDNELDSEYIERHLEMIQEIAERSRAGYLIYSKQMGMQTGGNYAVVDFIAVGNTQKCLSKTLPFSFYGFYYGTYSSESTDEEPIEYYLQGKNPTLLQEYVGLENYFSSPEPSLNYMSEKGFPVFQKERRTKRDLQEISLAWDAAASFIDSFFDIFYIQDEVIQSQLIEEMYAAVSFFGSEIPVYDDWFQTEIRKRPSGERYSTNAKAGDM